MGFSVLIDPIEHSYIAGPTALDDVATCDPHVICDPLRPHATAAAAWHRGAAAPSNRAPRCEPHFTPNQGHSNCPLPSPHRAGSGHSWSWLSLRVCNRPWATARHVTMTDVPVCPLRDHSEQIEQTQPVPTHPMNRGHVQCAFCGHLVRFDHFFPTPPLLQAAKGALDWLAAWEERVLG